VEVQALILRRVGGPDLAEGAPETDDTSVPPGWSVPPTRRHRHITHTHTSVRVAQTPARTHARSHTYTLSHTLMAARAHLPLPYVTHLPNDPPHTWVPTCRYPPTHRHRQTSRHGRATICCMSRHGVLSPKTNVRPGVFTQLIYKSASREDVFLARVIDVDVLDELHCLRGLGGRSRRSHAHRHDGHAPRWPGQAAHAYPHAHPHARHHGRRRKACRRDELRSTCRAAVRTFAGRGDSQQTPHKAHARPHTPVRSGCSAAGSRPRLPSQLVAPASSRS